MSEAENVCIPRAVGRYHLYRAIAAGGMATVHYGRMQGPVGFARTVAIKRLHREYARDPEFIGMFMEEARLAARVHHPNVVQTLDVVAADGELFLIMEYVPAVSLAKLMQAAQARAQRLPAAVAASIVAGVLRGLHAAHEAGDEEGNPLDIVHRDVSPQNILVGADGGTRVLDFGIAKATGRATQTTREGQVKGKFAYMAPEQITNVGVTRQSDIFAASIVLWEGLTGRRLFQAESESALLARVLSAPIEAPSAVIAGLGAELDAVVLRGLARDLSVRYATGREMACALEAHITLASPTQVGEWVEHLAGDELAQRAACVAEIENESRSQRVSVRHFLASAQAPRVPTHAPNADRVRSRRRRGLAALFAAATLIAVAIGTTIFSDRNATGRAAVAGVPSAALSAQTAPAPALVETPAADTSGTAPATAGEASTFGTRHPDDTKPAPTRSVLRTTAAHPACDPPYYVDSSGHLIYKQACFR